MALFSTRHSARRTCTDRIYGVCVCVCLCAFYAFAYCRVPSLPFSWWTSICFSDLLSCQSQHTPSASRGRGRQNIRSMTAWALSDKLTSPSLLSAFSEVFLASLTLLEIQTQGRDHGPRRFSFTSQKNKLPATLPTIAEVQDLTHDDDHALELETPSMPIAQ
jgi:hypothetical protein